MPEADVLTILEAVPEFEARYLDMVEALDDDPDADAEAAFAELADLAARLVAEIERHRPVLVRLVAAVEAVAAGSEQADELVGWAFLDNLSPDDLRRLEPWFGPATRSVLHALEAESGRAEGRP